MMTAEVDQARPNAGSSGTPNPDPATEFAFAWDDLARVVRRARGRHCQARTTGLTVSQFHLLDALQATDSLSVRELAEAAGVTSPTATRMLDSLERDGNVLRSVSKHDARAIDVRLTPAGHEAVDQARGRLRVAQRALFNELNPNEQREAASLLRRLADAVVRLGVE